MAADAKQVLARWDRLKAKRDSHWMTLWQTLGDYCQPRKSSILTQKSPGVDGWTDNIFDTTGPEALMILAAGIVTEMTPGTDRWFAYEAPASLRARMDASSYGASRAADYYQRVTEILHEELARSNFYDEFHEAMLDRSGFGTSALFCKEGRETTLNFSCLGVGTYAIDQNDEGRVDTVFREFPLSARQAVSKFGEDALGPKVLEAARKPDGEDQMFTFIHGVYPRPPEDIESRYLDGANKPIVSCYVCKEDQLLVEESGFDEMPVAVGRFLTWPGEVYGWGPGLDALPTIRQVNLVEKYFTVWLEKQADPPYMVPSNIDQVDTRAHGETIYDESNPTALPREWLMNGRMDLVEAFLERKRAAIRKAFHNELFQLLANIEPGKMTWGETMSRMAEKLTLFSPTFHRITTEMLGPTLLRAYAIAGRRDLLPPPPEDILVETPEGYALPMPQVVYTSKMALAIKALENRAFVEFVNLLLPISQAVPDALDTVDFDVAVPSLARNWGVPARFIRDAEKRDAMRQARAQVQQQQMALEAAQGMAKAGADMGKAPPEMREAMEQAMGG